MVIRRVAERLAHAILLLFAVSALTFVLLSAAPGGFFDEAKLNPRVSPETIEKLRSAHGLNRPLPVRYGHWLASSMRGDFGTSLAYNQPVLPLIVPRIRNTLFLTAPSLVLAWLVALPLGMWSGARRGGFPEHAVSAVVAILLAVPELIFGTVIVYWASVTGLLPSGGMTSGSAGVTRHAILPIAVLTLGALPVLLLHVKDAVAHAVAAPYVRTALALGVRPRRLWLRYVLPGAANPLISLFGLSIAGLISASLLVETVFGWPGLGPMLREAVLARDPDLVLAPVLCSASILIAGNLAADMLLIAADPRIRVPAP